MLYFWILYGACTIFCSIVFLCFTYISSAFCVTEIYVYSVETRENKQFSCDYTYSCTKKYFVHLSSMQELRHMSAKLCRKWILVQLYTITASYTFWQPFQMSVFGSILTETANAYFNGPILNCRWSFTFSNVLLNEEITTRRKQMYQEGYVRTFLS